VTAESEPPPRILRVGQPHRGMKSVVFIWEGGCMVGSLPVPEDFTHDEMLKAIKEALRIEA